MEEILIELAKQSPLVAVFVVAVLWLKARIKEKEDDLKALHQELRESEKTSIEAFTRVTDILKNLSSEQTSLSKDILNELKSLREWLGFHITKNSN